MAVFLYLRGREITDDLVELMIRAVKCIGTRAESNVEKAYIKEVKKVRHKNVLLYKMASAAWDQNERIQRTVYELCVFKALREKLRCKEIWVVGADRFRNPDEDPLVILAFLY